MIKSTSDFRNYQFIPPFTSSSQFEIFAEELFNELYKTHNFKRRSRSGQAQNKFDVYSYSDGIYVECKLKNIVSRSKDEVKDELKDEMKSCVDDIRKNDKLFKAKSIYLLSNFPADREIEDLAIQLSKRDKKVFYWNWEKILVELNNCPRTFEKYKPELDIATRDYFEYRSPVSIKNSNRNNRKGAFILLKEFQDEFFPLIAFKPNFLQNTFPFNNTDDIFPSSRYFLDIKNKKIKRFIQNIYVGRKSKLKCKYNSDTSSKDLENILDICGANLYYFIEDSNTIKRKLLPIKFENNCECIRCCFYKLDFEKLLLHLKKNNKDYNVGSERDKLKNAFINFKVGNFKESYLQLKRILNTKGPNYVALRFVCHYNIQNLKYQILSYYEGKDKNTIINEIDNLDSTYRIILSSNSKELKNQLEWFNEDAFVKDNAIKVDRYIAKINKSIREGYNALGSVDDLLDILSNMYSSIQSNYLFYDIYDSFETVVEKSIDSLVGAYSVQHLVFKNEAMRGFPISTIHFNDFLFDLMIFHTNTDKLIEIFHKYSISELPAHKNILVIKLKNLLKTFTAARRLCDKQVKINNYFFDQRIERTFANLVLVISKIKINGQEFKEVPQLLINFFKSENRIAWYSIQSLGYLIYKNEKTTLFTGAKFEELLNIVYFKSYSRHGLLQTITTAIEKYYPNYQLKTQKISNHIIRNYTKDRFEDLISFWKISNLKQKNVISKYFNDLLIKQFDETVYLHVAIYEIIDYKQFMFKYVNVLFPSAKTWGYERVGNRIRSYSLSVNWLVSLIYKFNIDTKEYGLPQIANTHDYFNWLLNLETFDYTKFNLDWLGIYEHPTYFNKFKTISILKDTVEFKLKEKYDSFISDIYYKNIL